MKPSNDALKRGDTVLDETIKRSPEVQVSTATGRFGNILRKAYQAVTDKFSGTFGENRETRIKRELYRRGAITELEQVVYDAATAYVDFARGDKGINTEQWHANPTELIAEQICRHSKNCFIVYGEVNHHETGVLAYEWKLLEELHGMGIKIDTVYLEESMELQESVDKYMHTGIMDAKLETYLTTGFQRKFNKLQIRDKITLLKTCRDIGAKVKFIDDYKVPDRDEDWFKKLEADLGNTIQGVHFLFAGGTHASKQLAPKPIKNWFGGFRFTPSCTQHLFHKYGSAIVSICVAALHQDRQKPDWYHTVTGEVLERDIKTLVQEGNTTYEQGVAILLNNTIYGDLPFSYVPGRTKRSGDEYDIMVAVPSEYIFAAQKT